MAERKTVSEDRIVAQIKKSLAKSLRDFGYPNVPEDEVLTDLVYRRFARNQMRDVISEYPGTEPAKVCQRLIGEIDALDAAERK